MRMRYQQRANPDGTIPENALWKAKVQRDDLILRQSEAGWALNPTSWTWRGPGNIGGRIRAILIHPTTPNTMYVGSCGGGIWKTTNGGTSWFPLNEFMASLSVGCMWMDRTNPDVLYAGTGEGFFEAVEGTSNTATIRGAGIFKSVDAGVTWFQLPSTANPDFYFVNRLAQSPTNSSLFLAATSTGIFRSLDSGGTWTKVRDGWAYDVKFHPTDGNRVAAGMHGSPSVLFSSDAGVNWTAATGITNPHRAEVVWAPSASSTLYAAVNNTSQRIHVYRSVNYGGAFTLMTSGNGISALEAYTNALWIDPINSNTLVVGGVNLYRSTDGGVTLSSTFSGVHSDHHVIVQHPAFDGTNNRTVYFGGDGGIYRTTNIYGSSSTELNNNLGVTQFYGGAMSNTTGVAIAGAQDNYTTRFSGNIEGWVAEIGGDGGFCANDPTDPNYFYGGSQNLNIFRSSDGGLNWVDINDGILDRSGGACNFISFYMIDPNEPNRMLVGARRLWRSNDVKTGNQPTWAVIKDPIGGSFREFPTSHYYNNSPFNISTLTVAKGNSDLIWVGYNNGQVWKTTNGTAATPTWTRVGVGVLPDRWVSRIAIDPNNHDRVFISVMGWTDGNVWKTEDGGSTFTDAAGVPPRRLPVVPVSALALNPLNGNHLIVGTDIGIFTSYDGGATWSAETQGPGTVPIEELVWRDATRLLAFTYGRGLFEADVTPADAEALADAMSVVRGILVSGGLSDIRLSDDLRVVVQNGITIGPFDPPIQVQVSMAAPQRVANALRFDVEGSVNSVNLTEAVHAWDFDAGAWVLCGTGAAPLSESVRTYSPPGAVSRFIHPGTKEVRIRVSYARSGPGSGSTFQARLDQVRCRVNY